MATTYDFPEPGLYFDAGYRTAIELDMEIIEMAHEYGWVDPHGMTNTKDVSEEDEFLNEIADEAIEFLNSLETREGYSWGYGDNGEGFGLWNANEE